MMKKKITQMLVGASLVALMALPAWAMNKSDLINLVQIYDENIHESNYVNYSLFSFYYYQCFKYTKMHDMLSHPNPAIMQ